MDINELRTVRRTEREKDSLQHLRDSFYEDVAVFLSDLKAQRDRAAERAEDPFASDEVRQLTDRIEAAEEVSEAIYERRVGKVVKLASFAAADMSVETEGMTAQEHQLFEDIVGRIKRNKSTVLDILAGEHDPAAATDAAAGPTEAHPAEPAAPTADAGAKEIPSAPNPAAETDADRDTEEAQGTTSESGMLADAMGGDSAGHSESADRTASGPDGPATGADTTAAGTDITAVGHTSPSTEPSAATVEAESPAEAPPDAPPEETRVAATPGTGESGDAGDEDGRTPVEPEAAPPDAPERGGGESSTDGGLVSDASDTERTTVRITRDIGQIVGTDDREYDLAHEDVVTLPATNAAPLLQKDAAEKLE